MKGAGVGVSALVVAARRNFDVRLLQRLAVRCNNLMRLEISAHRSLLVRVNRAKVYFLAGGSWLGQWA